MEPKHSTPVKLIHNILLEKTVQGKFSHAFNCDSPFRLLPAASTPPSGIAKIRNPFEPHLSERLHQSVFSPSVFSTAKIIKTEDTEKFKWTIEDISNLKPADIDEATVHQQIAEHDPEVECAAQANIEKFFSEKHIVPSPFNIEAKTVPLICENASSSKIEEQKQTTDGVAQTILTLPPILPKNIEKLLEPYFSYTMDQQQDANRQSSLYRRLFNFDEEQHSPSSVLTSPAPSCNLSPIEFSPIDSNKMQPNRNFDSPSSVQHLSPECNLSPIHTNDNENSQTPARSISLMRMHTTEQMSIDTSLNLVPDMDQVPSNNHSLAFETTRSPAMEVLSNSSVNWDIEYKQILLDSPNSDNEMDVSNSNTPKSKIFTSMRKKLSDSFLKIEELDTNDDDKENIYFEQQNVKRMEDTTDVGYQTTDGGYQTTDGGYHTGYGLPVSEESWSSSQLFASTPTKK